MLPLRSSALSFSYLLTEFFLSLKAEFINPFNPDEIDITANFTSPIGKNFLIHGFYNYSFGSLWNVRFSPDETGKWKYAITVKDKSGQVSSESKPSLQFLLLTMGLYKLHQINAISNTGTELVFMVWAFGITMDILGLTAAA